MNINEITKEAGAHRKRRRLGRGESSGVGKTCGRGHKGCNARSGGGARPLTEGGQMPLFRRIAKRGFNNYQFRKNYAIVNLGDLERVFDSGAKVDAESLIEKGLLRNEKLPLKVLGDGALSKKLTVVAHKFSKQAAARIAEAGGEVKTLG